MTFLLGHMNVCIKCLRARVALFISRVSVMNWNNNNNSTKIDYYIFFDAKSMRWLSWAKRRIETEIKEISVFFYFFLYCSRRTQTIVTLLICFIQMLDNMVANAFRSVQFQQWAHLEWQLWPICVRYYFGWIDLFRLNCYYSECVRVS